MKDEERSHCDAYFQEELEFLKVSVARLTSLLEQAIRNFSGEGPSNQPVTFIQTLITTQPKERIGDPTFIQPATLTSAPTVMDVFFNESHKLSHLMTLINIRWQHWKLESGLLKRQTCMTQYRLYRCVWFQMWWCERNFMFLNSSNTLEHNSL
jgi:hypothetical protein